MNFSFTEVDSSWEGFFTPWVVHLDAILNQLEGLEIAPERENVFRAFRLPLDRIKVVIVGQDPYPGVGVADGLAFSTTNESRPASLRNIYNEYCSDLHFDSPVSNDLTSWAENGVLLLNRTLTTLVGVRNAHLDNGWREFTEAVVLLLGQRGVVGILWGKNAEELAPHFPESIISPHPSPLSARRGFFGSQPFSRANRILAANGIPEVDWKLA